MTRGRRALYLVHGSRIAGQGAILLEVTRSEAGYRQVRESVLCENGRLIQRESPIAAM